MKAFIAAAGAIFALLAVSHVARFVVEGAHLLGEPIFIATTFISLGMTGWAAVLLFGRRK